MSETVYNFQPVSMAASGPLVFICYRCGCRVEQSPIERTGVSGMKIGTVWADLNGEPFKAYYCQTCKETAENPMSATNTRWERMPVNADTARYLRGTHDVWSRMFDGERIFTVLLKGKEPGGNDGGYRSIAAALRVKGMQP